MLVILTLNLHNFNKTALSPSLFPPTFQYFYTDTSAISVTFRNSVATLSNTCHTSIASRENWTLLLPNTSVFFRLSPSFGRKVHFSNQKLDHYGEIKVCTSPHYFTHFHFSTARNSFPNMRPGHLGQNSQGIGCILTCKILHPMR